MKNIRTITELANVAEFNIKSPRLHLRESMCMRHGRVHVSISTACLSEKGRALHSWTQHHYLLCHCRQSFCCIPDNWDVCQQCTVVVHLRVLWPVRFCCCQWPKLWRKERIAQRKRKEKKRTHIFGRVRVSVSINEGRCTVGRVRAASARMVAGANGSPMWFKEPRFRLLNKCSCIENVEKYFCALAVFVRQFKSFRKLARDLLPLHRMQRRSSMGDWQWLSSLSILR